MLKYAKAIVGGLATGLATYSTFAADGNVSANDWIAVLVATAGAAGLVAWVPNKQA